MTSELSYASGISNAPLLGQTIDANLRAAIERFPDRAALVDVAGGKRFTYGQLDTAVDDVARGLLGRGIARGDRVGIWAPNCAQWFLVQYATARIG
ncbi:MAG: AMP-binding protein, partial [Actinomycetota bacterium]|nr:AMP-binding protein [Actinomycetota bacterium]